MVFLQHDRGMAFGQRFLITRFGQLFGDHHAIQVLAAQLNLDAQQDGAPGQGEGVRHFHTFVRGVAKPLLDAGLEQHSPEVALDAHAFKHHGRAGPRRQGGVVKRLHGSVPLFVEFL